MSASKPAKQPPNPAPEIMLHDCLSRFSIPTLGLRAVHLNMCQSLQQAVAQHQYPEVIASWLGEVLAANVLLAHIVKIKGRVVLHIKNQDSPIQLLSSKSTHQLEVSGLVQWQASATPDELAAAALQGQLVISIMQHHTPQPYQSIVELNGQRIHHCLQHYFTQSEQLPTRLFIEVTHGSNGEGLQVQALLLQTLPGNSSAREQPSAADIQHNLDELPEEQICTALRQQQSGYRILRQLWPDQDIRHHRDQSIQFKCQCNRKRMSHALLTMGKTQCHKLLQQHPNIQVTCEFCGQAQSFNQHDIDKLWQ